MIQKWIKLCFLKPQLLSHRGIHLQKQFSKSPLLYSIWPLRPDSPDFLLRLLKTVIFLTALPQLCPTGGRKSLRKSRNCCGKRTWPDWLKLSVPSEQETAISLVLYVFYHRHTRRTSSWILQTEKQLGLLPMDYEAPEAGASSDLFREGDWSITLFCDSFQTFTGSDSYPLWIRTWINSFLGLFSVNRHFRIVS